MLTGATSSIKKAFEKTMSAKKSSKINMNKTIQYDMQDDPFEEEASPPKSRQTPPADEASS